MPQKSRACLCTFRWQERNKTQLVSKKWCDSCIQLRLDPSLDRITGQCHMMLSPTQSLPDYSFHIWFSVSLFIWTAPLFLLPLSLTPVFLSTFSFSLSLYPSWFHSALHTGPHIMGWLSPFKCGTVWQKRTVSSICLVALLTPSCYKMQPGGSHWDAVRDTVHIFDINCIDSFISLSIFFLT